MRRMRLVPESDLPIEESDLSKILLTKQVPPEVKNLLYQDSLRRLLREKKTKAEKPILVREVSERSGQGRRKLRDDDFIKLSTPYILKMVPGLVPEKFFEMILKSGVQYNDEFEVTVNGVTYPASNIINILQHLVRKEERRNYIPPFGYDEVVRALLESSEDIPDNLFHYLQDSSNYNTPDVPAPSPDEDPRSDHVTVRRGSRGQRRRLSDAWESLDKGISSALRKTLRK